VGTKCWDQIAEGCLILNTEKNAKVNKHSTDSNKCTGSLPQGVYLYGWLGGLLIMSERPPPNHPVYIVYSHEGIIVILYSQILYIGPIMW
jgi:hypothetical protein